MVTQRDPDREAGTLFRIRLKISYNGGGYYGWQKQPNGEPTIQGFLEKHLSQILNETVRVVGSGRTDRGAHALMQYAHAEVPKDPQSMNLCYALNRLLPESIRVHEVALAPAEFHAQRSVVAKKYIYKIYNKKLSHPFWGPYSHHVPQKLDMELLNSLSAKLVGELDFKSFQSSGTEVESTLRRVFKAYWTQKGPLLTFHIVGNGFLKQMVRNIVGTLLWLHDQPEPEKRLVNIIKACDRQMAQGPAPAQGLFLKWVKYPPELDIKCRKL